MITGQPVTIINDEGNVTSYAYAILVDSSGEWLILVGSAQSMDAMVRVPVNRVVERPADTYDALSGAADVCLALAHRAQDWADTSACVFLDINEERLEALYDAVTSAYGHWYGRALEYVRTAQKANFSTDSVEQYLKEQAPEE